MEKADIGVIGLAVMGQNLVLNLLEKGYKVAVFNRSYEKTLTFEKSCHYSESLIACENIQNFVKALKTPAMVLLMVKSGAPVEAMLSQLNTLLPKKSIVMDGGNSYFEDTLSRQKQYSQWHYLGVGISGGEEGARHGPSIMVGGAKQAWPQVQELLESVSAKVEGSPCCAFLGGGGAGHLVKMVHNGIEYALMQLIAELYDYLKRGAQYSNQALSQLFESWMQSPVKSYLVQISAKIFAEKDLQSKGDLIDQILDVAAQKGTGKWTAQLALDYGQPLGMLTEAVYARYLSTQKEERIQGAKKYNPHFDKPFQVQVDDLTKAFHMAMILAFSQGFSLIHKVSTEKKWDISLSKSAMIWRGGCILQCGLLQDIAKAFEKNTPQLLLYPPFVEQLKGGQAALRRLIAQGTLTGIPMPVFSSSLAYFDGFCSQSLPANLIQAQRDCFGAHGFQRLDDSKTYHHQWQ